MLKAFFFTLLAFSSLFAEEEPKTALSFEEGKTYFAHITTGKGAIICQLFPTQAPLSVTNFITLAAEGFYNGLQFYRLSPNFVILGGDPKGDGGLGYTLAPEIHMPHERGALACARLSDAENPERRSSSCQFYITLAKTPHLDGEYTVFGQTVSGMDIVDQLIVGDKIERIEIIVK